MRSDTAAIKKTDKAVQAACGEEALSERKYRTLIENLPQKIFLKDKDSVYVSCNENFARDFKIKHEEITGKTDYDLFPSELAEKYRADDKRIAASGKVEEIEEIYIKDGRKTAVQTIKTPLRDEKGNVSGILGIFWDISERKRAEEALKKERDALQVIMENTKAQLAYLDSGFNFIRVNSAYAWGSGHTKGELIGTNYFELFPGEERAIFEKVRDTGEAVEFKAKPIEFADQPWRGVTYWDWTLAPIRDTSGKVYRLVLSLVDVTEMKKAEEVLRGVNDDLEKWVKERTAELSATNELLKHEIIERRLAEEQIMEQAALLDKAQDAIAVRDLEHRLIYWNKGAEHLYGFTAEEAIGKNANELLYIEESPELIEAKKNAIEKGEWTGELRQITKEGRKIIVESRWTLVRDRKGKPKSILIINTDVTAKKNLEAQLLRAQRLESIGTLASGIAHDINNVLSPILMSLQLLQERWKDEESRKLIDVLERSAMRGASLIKQVQSFARGVEGQRAAIKAASLISEIRQIVTETFPKNIELITDVQNDLFTIYGDATQLHQVLMNLCVNARDAMPDGGVLSLSAENLLIDENYARMNLEAKVGPYVVITVADTGTGIPPEIKDRIFEPFFTTKEFGKGTGLGLSTVFAIVKGHGGFINVESDTGRGTAFRVYLPAVKTEEMKKAEEQLEIPRGHGEFILVVDDEASIREITTAILESNGYEVIMAEDGADAVAQYMQNREVINAVLMDLMMPVMGGSEGIRALLTINPELRIIAVSGLTEKDQLKKIKHKVRAFLPKPYTAGQLLKTVHEVLNTK